MEIKSLQTAFTSGEISPRLKDRIDLDQYYSSAMTLENFLPTPQGPVIRRPGFTHIATLPEITGECRLVPFVFSVDQSFVICFHSNGKVYFFFKRGIISNEDGTPYSVDHGFTVDTLKNFDYAQSGDILYIVDKDIHPKTLTRKANDQWEFADEEYALKADKKTSTMPTQWKEGNWPSLIAFYGQRCVYAATPSEPQTLWMSRVGLYNDFEKEGPDKQVLDDMAIEYTIASDDVNGIVWLLGISGLMLGTSGGEYKVAASLTGEALTPNNTTVTKITGYGSAKTKPFPLGLGIAYVQRSSRAVRHVGPDQLGTFNSTDLMTMANHIGEVRIKQLALQTNPYTILWVLMEDGTLSSLSYDKENKVLAWSRHIMANGKRKIISISCIPDESGKDELWALSVNTDGVGPKTLMVDALLEAAVETWEVEESKFLDSMLFTKGTRASQIEGQTVGGLEHLVGQEVSILVDGWAHPNRIVAEDGTVELQQKGNKIVVGLPFTSTLQTINFQSSQSNTAGSYRRIYKVGLTFLNSLGARVSAGAKEEELYFGPTRVMNKAEPLFSGTKDIPVSSTWGKELRIIVTQDKPLPCEITNIIAYLSAN